MKSELGFFCWLWTNFCWFLMKNSNIYYINDRLDKRTWTYIFGACCATTVFIPSFHNYRIWSFLGLGMTTYTAWYLTIASFTHGQVKLITTFFVFHLKRVNGVSLIWFNFVISGWGCDTFSSNKASAILHRSYKHTLHFWWPCCDCVSFIFLHGILSSFLFTCFYAASVCSFCRPSWCWRPTDNIMQSTFLFFVCSETTLPTFTFL